MKTATPQFIGYSHKNIMSRGDLTNKTNSHIYIVIPRKIFMHPFRNNAN